MAAPNTRAGRRQAEEELERLQTLTAELTVAEAIEEYRASKWAAWSPTTRAKFASTVKPLIDAFGADDTAELTARRIERTYGRWAADGLAASTIRRRHVILAAALTRAERHGIVAIAPTRKVELPASPDVPPPDLPDLATVMAAVDGIESPDWLRIAARLTLATGMRRGELCALRWADLELDGGQGSVSIRASIAQGPDGTVRKATKSRRAAAAVALDVETIRLLTTWRADRQDLARRLGVRWVASWPVLGSAADPCVPMVPERVTRAWGRVRDGLGVGSVRWHDLRHIVASELVAAGVDPVTIAARLGHDPSMLLSRYAHARPVGDQAAADVIAAAVAKAKANGAA